MTRLASVCAGGLLVLLALCGAPAAHGEWPRVVPSKDGTFISYEVAGTGEPTLIFVHGWSCDGRYWRGQAPYFSGRHRVIVVDLAGHGHSGTGRTRYTMRAFGEDVQAVAEAEHVGRAILIGHSMGGSVIAQAARLMPDRVIGLVGVDTLENVEYPLTREALGDMLAPLEKDFPSGTRQFVASMFLPDIDPRVREWILADVAAAPPAVALSAMREMMGEFVSGEAARVFDGLRVPVVSVNGSLWPVDREANRRHMVSYEAVILDRTDHFFMLEHPAAFNRALEQALAILQAAPAAP